MDESTPTRGRPRSEAVRRALLAAAFAQLVERGYGAMSLEGVAQAAGAGKATIYRWWRSKAELAVEAFFHATRAELAFPDLGSAAADFGAQIRALGRALDGPAGRAFAAMLAGAAADPALARALDERWLTPRQAWGRDRIAAAAATGELRPGVDVAAALGLLYGPLYAPLLFNRPVPDAVAIERHLALALPAVFVDGRG